MRFFNFSLEHLWKCGKIAVANECIRRMVCNFFVFIHTNIHSIDRMCHFLIVAVKKIRIVSYDLHRWTTFISTCTDAKTIRGMHFIDFLLHLLCFIIATVRSIYNFCVEFIVPAVVYVLPVLLKCVGHLITGFLWIYFTYIAPCIIYLLNMVVQIFAHSMNGLGYLFLSIAEFDTKFVNFPAILIGLCFVAVIYFRITGKVYNFCKDGWQLTQMNVRFCLHFTRMLSTFVTYLYRRVVARFRPEPTTKIVKCK